MWLLLLLHVFSGWPRTFWVPLNISWRLFRFLAESRPSGRNGGERKGERERERERERARVNPTFPQTKKQDERPGISTSVFVGDR